MNHRCAGPLIVLAVAIAFTGGCRRATPGDLAEADLPSPIVDDVGSYTATTIGSPFEGKPWITHLTISDLDRDGRPDILACDSQKNAIVWLRQITPTEFAETAVMSDLAAPVHITAVDMDGDADLDLIVACMGQIFPTNDRIGSIVVLENDGMQRFTKHVIAERTARVTDVQSGDFNGDGRRDLAVGQFGYDQGEIRWMENRGGWRFDSHSLLNLSGTVNVCVADFDGNGREDIVAVVSQQYEEIHLFDNTSSGSFGHKVIFGSINEDFGSSGLSICDLNRDGRPDLLYSNGDGFDYADPGSRPWHGVQWLENRGGGDFRYHRIGDLPGAYSPVGADVNGDGKIDVVAVSGFNDWKDPGAVSLIAYHNDGNQRFTAHVLAHAPTHLVTVATADFDADGRPELITGGFHAYPPWDRMSRIMLWSQKKP